ncbi:MAG: hypothetical protein E3J78_05040 [Candidatus Cloacimonadota bacterium]|jgi:predicted  nucleic acid-binding Zn-ribbon protein|nr:MAG: hypothetical protein E3J78_05040 [Candidatus Cloacimonadota bacterium]
MKEVLVQLFKLQSIDRDVLQKERMIEQIPQRMQELTNQINKQKEIFDEVEQRLKEDSNTELAIERKFQETKMSIERHKKQLVTVKTNKEYAALLKEIAAEEADIERLEEEMLVLLDNHETMENEKKEEEQALNKMQERYEKDKKMLEEKKVLFEKEIMEKKVERENIGTELESSLLKRYERIRKLRDGIAVVQIQGENCGGCFTRIPPQVINEAKRGDRILTCESCGRIIIYMEEG